MNITDPRRATSYDMIFLADNEWGSPLMKEVADEWFAAHPDCNFVHVYEHAGWSLTFHRGGEVVHTANDAAVMRPDRPRPTHGSTIQHRRPVIRRDLDEVTTLADYTKPTLALEHFVAELAREMDVHPHELTA